MGLIAELRRRNVFRMAVLYLGAAWLVMQVVDVLIDRGPLPESLGPITFWVLVVGFPIALALSWFYEITPEGVTLDEDVEPGTTLLAVGRRVDFIIIAVMAAALLLFAYDKWWLHDAGLPEGYANSVAVLAFDDLSPDGDQEWFSDGLSEEIINSLSQLPELKVTARTSAFHFKGLDLPIPEIAATLGVAHVVEGSVRRAGDRMRITAQLIKADDGFHLWSETYDRPTDDVFEVQEDIAENIASALDIYLDEERRVKMFQTGTRNVQAYEAYLRGQKISRSWHGTFTEGALWEGQRLFARALEYDPEFARAHWEHGDAYYHYARGQIELPPDADAGLTPEVALDLLFQDHDRAIEFEHNEELRVVYQIDQTLFSNDWSGLRSLLDQLESIRQTSTNPVIMEEFDWHTTFVLLGRNGIESNYRHFRRSLEVVPMDRPVMAGAIRSAVYLSRLEEALELIEQVERIHGSAAAAHYRRFILFETGHYDELLADPDAHPSLRPLLLVLTGQHDEARALIDERLAEAERPNLSLAWTLQLLGETDYAKERFRTYDAHPLYTTILMELIWEFDGRLIWDLEWTPNFAARLEEMGVELDPYEFPLPAE